MAELTPKQREVVDYWFEHRPLSLILEGAVRSGKTVVNIWLWVLCHLARFRNQNKHFIMTGYTIGSLKKNVVDVIEEMFGYQIKLSLSNEFSLLGNKICCFGTDKSDSYKAMRGMTAYGWYANEVTLSHPNSIDEAFKRCSGDGSKIFWDTNPDHPEHFVKTQYIDESGDVLPSGQVRLKSFHFKLDDNVEPEGYLSQDYIENLKRSTPPGIWYDRGILGKWVAAEGVVYPGFQKDVHVIDPFEIPVEWTRYVGIDWGFNNPLCVLWIARSPDDVLYVYDEHYLSGTLLKDHAEHIKAREADYARRDEQGEIQEPLIKWRVADHDEQDAAEMRRLGVRTRPVRKGRGSVRLGIEKVAERLIVRDNGKAGLYILRGRAPNLVREMGMYVWGKSSERSNEPEEPVKKDDHTCDTLRYIVYELDYPGVPIISVTQRIA